MDFLEVNQPGGFPMTTNILNHLQNASRIFNSLGALAGDFSIISGCEEVGSTVSDGVVYFKNELFPFKGGSKTSKIRIIETSEAKTFQDGTTKAVVFKRYVEFGTAVTDFLWSDFKRIDPLVSLTAKVSSLEKKAAVFIQGGGMVLWNKPATDIPEGWQEVVNWRGRMPVGFDSTQTEFNVMGKDGGEKTHQLTIDEMPKHRFQLTQDVVSFYDENNGVGNGGDGPASKVKYTNYLGSDKPHNNLSPYRVVMFIECIV